MPRHSLPRAVIVTSQRSPETGGIQAWSQGLSYNASDAGYQVTTWGLRDRDLGWAVRGLWALARADRVVFASWKYFLAMLPLLKVQRLFGRSPAMLLLVHGLELADLQPRGLQTLNRAVADFRVRLMANSTFTLQKAQAAGVTGELECCHPSVILPKLELRAENTQVKQIVTVTRLVERKNLFRAIDAVAALNREGADLEYSIIGEGPLQGALTDYANTHGGGRVHLLGAVDEPTKWRRLQSADVFVLPSVDSAEGDDFEGYGLALIEANWAGVPVVAGPSGGMPEAVQSGRTGYVSDGSAAGIAECICQLIHSPLPVDAIRDWAARHQAGSAAADSGFVKRGIG